MKVRRKKLHVHGLKPFSPQSVYILLDTLIIKPKNHNLHSKRNVGFKQKNIPLGSQIRKDSHANNSKGSLSITGSRIGFKLNKSGC